jgi:hypothetical protein
MNSLNVSESNLIFDIQGSIIATAAVYAAHNNLSNDGQLDWRLPLWLQMLCPGLVTLGIWFCPESPRW